VTVMEKKEVIKDFHILYYNVHLSSSQAYWKGIPVQKCPLDLWQIQEIIYETRPDIIIESGTGLEGSTLFMADICSLIGHGKIITIDIFKPSSLLNDRIMFVQGSSTSEEVVNRVTQLIPSGSSVMVNLDSDHHKDHVLKELRIYSKLVTVGNYLILEDTNINNPVLPGWGEGPREALDEFLKENHDFIIDKSRERFLLTFFPGGYLKKKVGPK